MDSSDYPIKIFNLHVNRAYPNGLPNNSVILELGPGDSVSSALLGFAHNAQSIYLVDVGDFARKDVGFYRNLSELMEQKGMRMPDISSAKDINDILDTCNARYLTKGLKSLKSIDSNSVDFVWSHSVLEHVSECEFSEVQSELYRILKPGALASHNIDFQDHLDYSLNNLRFSKKLWESLLFTNSGFYTNRIPAIKMHEMIRNAGFKITHEAFGKWSKLPIQRESLHVDFQKYSDEELSNRTSSILVKKPNNILL